MNEVETAKRKTDGKSKDGATLELSHSQKGPHVDWHFWANQIGALWTFSQLKRNSARFGARRRHPEGLLHGTEGGPSSANRHYYSLEMTGLSTNSCPFQRAPGPAAPKRKASTISDRQSA